MVNHFRRYDMNEGNFRNFTFETITISLERDVPPEGSTHVTAVLNYCKTKILNPYLRLLSCVGLRPLFADHEFNFGLKLLNYTYISLVIALLITGYILQYLSYFSRDKGIYFVAPHNQTLHIKTIAPNELFSLIIPSLLHFSGYLYSVVVFKHSDDDQLPVLMERVFLSSSTLLNDVVNQKRLVRTLWVFVAITGVWMGLSFLITYLIVSNAQIEFMWFDGRLKSRTMKYLLVLATLAHDTVQATIISNYCLQAQLLTSYSRFVRDRLLQYPVQSVEWMRDIEDFKKMLSYFNEQISPAASILTAMNISYGISVTFWHFSNYNLHEETISTTLINISNILLWICISLAPFIQAARLSEACEILRNVGQEVRIRPFVHQDTPAYELDSILLYTISLRLNGKLFNIPIRIKYLSLIVAVAGISILVMGQCYLFN